MAIRFPDPMRSLAPNGPCDRFLGPTAEKISWFGSTFALPSWGELGLHIPSPPRAFGIFAFLVLFVAAVSVHDVMLVVLNHEVILTYEQNPIGLWLLKANGGAVWLFVAVKLLSTSMVCTVLVGLYDFRRRLGLAAASGLSVFQGFLLLYLSLN
jgi:hypothetical protein